MRNSIIIIIIILQNFLCSPYRCVKVKILIIIIICQHIFYCADSKKPAYTWFILLLHKSALQLLWVMACSTVVEYSQQEGFYRVPLPGARQTTQLGGPVITTFQLPPLGVRHVWNDASEPQQRKVELCARKFREFCRKWRLPRHFCVLLHAVNLRHGTDGFTSPLKEGALRIFSPEKSDGFGRVWTSELGYQRPVRSPLDHWSRYKV